jgi:hypothetical protein
MTTCFPVSLVHYSIAEATDAEQSPPAIPQLGESTDELYPISISQSISLIDISVEGEHRKSRCCR